MGLFISWIAPCVKKQQGEKCVSPDEIRSCFFSSWGSRVRAETRVCLLLQAGQPVWLCEVVRFREIDRRGNELEIRKLAGNRFRFA